MIHLTSVFNPPPVPPTIGTAGESETVAPLRQEMAGYAGVPSEQSRSLKYLVGTGKTGPLIRLGTNNARENILGPTDDRARILDTDLAPWRMICALRIRGVSGATAIGTGWLVGPRTLLTAGHCVYSREFFGGWAARIEVSPGRNGVDFPFGTIISQHFRSIDRWTSGEDPDFDIGCIRLEDPIGNQVGWFSVAALPPAELDDYLVNVSGYPGDRGAGTELYHHKNRVLHVTDRRMFYDVDTYGGQSGAPVWIHESGGSPPLAVGIHAYGVGASVNGLVANSAPRIIPETLEQIREWVIADGGWPEQL